METPHTSLTRGGNYFHRSPSLEMRNNTEPNSVPLASSLMHVNLHIQDNIQNVIQPLVESINIANLMNRTPNQQQSSPSTTVTETPYVVTIDPNHTTNTESIDTETQHHDNSSENPGEDHVNTNSAEVAQALNLLALYIPFVIVLLLKGMYDHQDGILHGIILFTIFAHTNSVVKQEATKRGPRNYTKLFLSVFYIVLAVFIIFYLNNDLMYHSVWLLNYETPFTMWDVLWYVGITDFIVKLVTVMLKIFVTLLPDVLVAFQSRGKIYLFIEALSQFYRSLLPLPTWYFYYIKSYQGAEQMVGILLFTAHFVAKLICTNSKRILLKGAFYKLMQNVTIGSSPSKEQLASAGENCPICHDEYKAPILLECSHIFCESCVTIWFDREQTCPLCRAKIVDDPSWRDGSTTFFIQLF